jgi:hypothetical protein
MKRTVVVSVLMLVLVLALGGEAFSRAVPWGYVDPEGDGDDHTWGGDFQVGIDGPGGVVNEVGDSWIPADMIISSFLFKWLGLHSFGGKAIYDADYTLENQTRYDEPIEPVIIHTGGNQ